MKEISRQTQAEIFSKQLVEACDALRVIDTRGFPLKDFSSGETKKVIKGKQIIDEYVSLPIFSENNIKGLRFGLKYVIFERRENLKKLGFGKEADEVIEEFKVWKGKKE